MRRLFAAAAVATLTFVAPACGDGDEETTTTRPATAQTADDDAGAATDTAAEPADDTTATTDDAETTDDANTAVTIRTSDDTGLDVGELSEECQQIARQLEDQFTNDADFGDIADAMEDIKELTPDEIDGDIDVLSGAYRRIANLIEERGGDLTDAMTDPEVLEELDSLDTPEIQKASENVEQFFADTCGL